MTKANRFQARQRRHARVRRKVVGDAGRPRLNVFRSATHIYAQVIDDAKGHTIAAASDADKDLAAALAGKPKVERAAIVGKTVAERAKQQGVSEVRFDRGGYLYHGRVKALADGAREAGLGF